MALDPDSYFHEAERQIEALSAKLASWSVLLESLGYSTIADRAGDGWLTHPRKRSQQLIACHACRGSGDHQHGGPEMRFPCQSCHGSGMVPP